MTDSAPFKPTIKICTPLIAGNKQDLRLQIETNRTVKVAVPLGDATTALMTVDEFNSRQTQISLRLLSEPDANGERGEVVGGRLPAGLLAPERKEENGVGYIQISLTRDRVFAFNIWLRNFVVQKNRGSVAIELQRQPEAATDPWPVLDKHTAAKVVPEPRITSFSASRYNVTQGDSVTLKWTIEPKGNFELRTTVGVKAKTLVEGNPETECSWIGNPQPNEYQDFFLEAWAGEKPASPDTSLDTRQLHIDINTLTGFKPYVLAPPAWPAAPGVLGLYAHRGRGRLYLLLDDNPLDASPPRHASLWYTEHGFTANPEAWHRATRKKDGVKPLIPVEAARRPGAIFNDKLFLIGGDCCDPNSAGANVGFCDLNDDTGLDWQEVGAKEAWSWPEQMAERMGHAVVVLPGDKGLWVVGGWRQDGGICDDIWHFTGTIESAWDKVEGLELPRCLVGATATRYAVWTVGGFGSPGGTPNDATVRRCAIGAKSWDNPDPSSREALPKVPDINATDYQYCASVLFSRERDNDDKPYGIAAFWNFITNAPERKYFFFQKRASWESPPYFTGVGPEVLVPSRNWYHMQSAVFRDAVFFRTLIADES